MLTARGGSLLYHCPMSAKAATGTPTETNTDDAVREPDAEPNTEPISALGAESVELSAEQVDSATEALLISSDRPLPPARIAEAIGIGGEGASAAIAEAFERLNGAYESSGRAFRIERVAGGLRLMTLPEHAGVLAKLKGVRQAGRLSKPAIETLAIVAYKQPITRAKLEAIRGVSCGEVLKSLIERRLVTITGRAEELGRPMLYGTTKQFLEAFGLASTRDLPTVAELSVQMQASPAEVGEAEAGEVDAGGESAADA